jgi:beta-galactosidase
MLDPKENIHDITDAIAWNRYFGWYYAEPKDMGKFLDETHKTYPEWCIGISEYGAGASIIQHSEKLKKPNPFGSPHPEEWQSYYHEEHLKIYNERPFIWGTFLWNMFDFGSQFRREGDHYGINDKGLVTFDRKTKKDAFYFFKANWSDEPVLYITSKRFIFRDNEKTSVKIYSNLPEVSLTVNGENMGSKSPENGIVSWENIALKKGNNGIVASGVSNGKTLSDNCVWVMEGFGTKDIAKIFDMMNYVPHILIVGLLLLLWFWFKIWRKKEDTPKWKRMIFKIFFFLIIFIEVLVIAMKILMNSVLG